MQNEIKGIPGAGRPAPSEQPAGPGDLHGERNGIFAVAPALGIAGATTVVRLTGGEG